MTLRTFLLLFCLITSPKSEAKTFNDARETFELTIGAADPAGLYYAFASTLSGILSKPPGSPACNARGHCGIPGLISHTTSTKGSTDNLDLLNTGKIGSALVQSDVFNGGSYPHIYVIMPLYPEALHIIVKNDAPFQTLNDLRDKNVSFGEEGSGTLYTATSMMQALGMPLKNFKVEKASFSNSLDDLLEGKLDAVCIMAGTPLKPLQELAKNKKIRLLSLSAEAQARIQKNIPELKAHTLAPGIYTSIDAVTTISTTALWVTAEQTSKNLAYDFLWSYGQEATDNILKRAGLIVSDLIAEKDLTRDMLKAYKDKLHPGALSYHRRRGII